MKQAMIEANEDISLVAERQIRDVEQGQAQAKAIAEGREMHPADIAAQEATPSADVPPAQEHAQILVEPSAKPPPDPDAALRHLRLSIVAIIALVLFFFWLRQKRS